MTRLPSSLKTAAIKVNSEHSSTKYDQKEGKASGDYVQNKEGRMILQLETEERGCLFNASSYRNRLKQSSSLLFKQL